MHCDPPVIREEVKSSFHSWIFQDGIHGSQDFVEGIGTLHLQSDDSFHLIESMRDRHGPTLWIGRYSGRGSEKRTNRDIDLTTWPTRIRGAEQVRRQGSGGNGRRSLLSIC
jgi:hypothetical protein